MLSDPTRLQYRQALARSCQHYSRATSPDVGLPGGLLFGGKLGRKFGTAIRKSIAVCSRCQRQQRPSAEGEEGKRWAGAGREESLGMEGWVCQLPDSETRKSRATALPGNSREEADPPRRSSSGTLPELLRPFPSRNFWDPSPLLQSITMTARSLLRIITSCHPDANGVPMDTLRPHATNHVLRRHQSPRQETAIFYVRGQPR